MPIHLFAVIASVLAALIAAGISFIHLTLTKEQKISDFRQTWIDGLREDLSTFFSLSRAMARATEEVRLSEEQKSNSKFGFTEDQVREMRLPVAQAYYKIKLRLNAGEAYHIQLLRLIDDALAAQISSTRMDSDGTKTIPALESAVEYSRHVLKTEWNRVKLGEPNFRRARTWIPIIILILVIVFCLSIWWVGFCKSAS